MMPDHDGPLSAVSSASLRGSRDCKHSSKISCDLSAKTEQIYKYMVKRVSLDNLDPGLNFSTCK